MCSTFCALTQPRPVAQSTPFLAILADARDHIAVEAIRAGRDTVIRIVPEEQSLRTFVRSSAIRSQSNAIDTGT